LAISSNNNNNIVHALIALIGFVIVITPLSPTGHAWHQPHGCDGHCDYRLDFIIAAADVAAIV
jgi:hypothetical protein